MSMEPEETLLEQALRGDLPSPATEARVRRRLLAAGVVIGNGVAATAATATGGAASTAASSGLLVKALGLSWGMKLGLAAAVTIPSVGLWLDQRSAPRAVVVAPALVPAPRVAEGLVPIDSAPVRTKPQALSEGSASAKVQPAPRAAGSLATDASTRPPAVAIELKPGSSQADFSAPERGLLSVPTASTLAEETRLLDQAFLALAAGNRVRAAAHVREHEQRYPTGLLLKERERAKARLSELSRGE